MRFAICGVGLRDRSLTWGLKPEFVGAAPFASRKYDRSGCSAASHSCLFSSWCWALRSARDSLTMGWTGAEDLAEVLDAVSRGMSICVVDQGVHRRPCPNRHPMRRALWWW